MPTTFTGQNAVVSIPGIAAKGVLTNGESTLIYASAYLTNNATFDNMTGFTNLMHDAASNATISPPAPIEPFAYRLLVQHPVSRIAVCGLQPASLLERDDFESDQCDQLR